MKYRFHSSKHYYAGSERIASRLAGPSTAFVDAEDLESDHVDALPALQQMDIRIPVQGWGIGLGQGSFENVPLPVDICGNYEAGSEEHKQCICEQEGNCPDVIYWYHPDHLGSSTFLTDLAGQPYQFVMYLPFGETFAEQRAAGFGTPYLFNAKELDEETGLYYYGARYYDPRVSMWWGVDPLAGEGPEVSPYIYTFNNPVRYIDPDGRWPGKSGIGLGFGFKTNFRGGFSASLALGSSFKSGNVMGSVNVAANFYNYGLGTAHGASGNLSFQRDIIISPALTGGSGSGNALPLNTFHNNSATGVSNDFQSSGSVGSNFVFNSDGRNQRVGYGGGKVGDVGVNIYNDIAPLGLGDKNDRWWSGGGSVQFASNAGNSIIGSDVFTGLRSGKDEFNNWLSRPGNPAGGLYGTYDQDSYNQLLNNGQSISTLPGINPINYKRNAGKDHMYLQNFIHNYLTKNKLFYSTAKDQ
ncbi:MAG: RHS repeat-associated core domain-containing protein [Saprospiraceae bacterium]|nr:RHS repeat-associated core domain-containing protein [Saprospiraceae bacterium]